MSRPRGSWAADPHPAGGTRPPRPHCGRGVIVPQAQVPLAGGDTLLPELLDRPVVEGHAERTRQDPRQLPGMEPVIERLEAVNLQAHRLRDPAGSRPDHHLDVGREEAEHPLLAEATPEGTHGVGMGVSVLRPLLDGLISEEHEGPNDLIAPLRPIHKAQLQLGKCCGRFHGRPYHPPCRRGASVAYGRQAVMQERARRGAARGSRYAIRSAPLRTGVKDVVTWAGLRASSSLHPLLHSCARRGERHPGRGKGLSPRPSVTRSC